MSLRIVHIAVILVSILLSAGFGVWCVLFWQQSGNSAALFMSFVSALGAGALAAYLNGFIRKTKKAGLK